MAEYYISYQEIEKLVDEMIAAVRAHEILEQHKPEIMAALTGDFEQNNWESVQEMIALWENQAERPSQLLKDTRYIRVQQSMIDFLKVAFTSGLIDAVILYASEGSFAGFTVSVGASIAIALWELFDSTKKLDDWDFCIYMQALTHFRAHQEFSQEELKDWLPSAARPYCNMHDPAWDCDFRDEDDICGILKGQRVAYAIKSLYDKGLLSLKKTNHKYSFRFKR